MIYRITAPQHINGQINLPASKSISNRALILNALSYSPYLPQNLSDCDDTRVMVNAFNSNTNTFDIGAAGTAMRFLTAFLSKIGGVWYITGSERMKNRPIGILVEALRQCGAHIEYTEKEGYPPLKITGKALTGGELTLEGGISSQFISALLMIAPTMQKGLTLHLTGKIISVPYIRMTLAMLKRFGIESHWENNTIKIAPQNFIESDYIVESDWSAASYWYEIVALMSQAKVDLIGLQDVSLQGDAQIAKFFHHLGVNTLFSEKAAHLNKVPSTTNRMDLDLTNQPDLAQTLVVTCALKGIPFRFSGLQSLKIKETDRIEALKNELRKLGYLICDSDGSILEWNGEKCTAEQEPLIETYEDHRMAMAFAPAAITFGSILIHHPEVVSKSYPHFWNDLEKMGFQIETMTE